MNKIKFKSKGFTFAELMVSLVIISVITALLYPTISELAPNNNKHLFKSAYRTVEMIVSEIVNASDTGVLPASTSDLCKKFESKLNTLSDTNCNAETPQLYTSNGMRWAFTDYSNNTFTIYIDVNASNNKHANMDCDAAIKDLWTTGCFRTNNDISRDTFQIQINNNGKVSVDSNEAKEPVGARHLKETSE